MTEGVWVRPRTQIQTFKHICTTAHTAARSLWVATKLAEQTATACSLSSQGVCLLIHTSFALSHNVKCLLVCRHTCVWVYVFILTDVIFLPLRIADIPKNILSVSQMQGQLGFVSQGLSSRTQLWQKIHTITSILRAASSPQHYLWFLDRMLLRLDCLWKSLSTEE